MLNTLAKNANFLKIFIWFVSEDISNKDFRTIKKGSKAYLEYVISRSKRVLYQTFCITGIAEEEVKQAPISLLQGKWRRHLENSQENTFASAFLIKKSLDYSITITRHIANSFFNDHLQNAVSENNYNCRFSCAGNWELGKSMLGTKFRRSHVFYILKRELDYNK